MMLGSPRTRQASAAGSLWTAGGMPAGQPLREDASADACVIGGGVSGLSVAYLLARAGRSVIVLDDGPLAGGMTGVTTAHLTCVLDRRYFELERVRGAEAARLAAASHMSAIDRIEAIIARERIRCDFERLNGYLFHGPQDDAAVLYQELAAAQRAGIDATITDRPPHDGLAWGPCLVFPSQAQFHPLRYLSGLARAIERDGGRLHTATRADGIEEGGENVVVRTGLRRVTARLVVVATHTAASGLLSVPLDQTAWVSYVLGARIATGAVTRALYWDTGRPYHYARVHSGPSGFGAEEVLVVGGEDHRASDAVDPRERFDRLEAFARERFPMIGRIEYAWSGQVLQTADGLAHIGQHPDSRGRVVVVSGDSGTGITHAMIAAILITDAFEARDNPWRALYDPARAGSASARDSS